MRSMATVRANCGGFVSWEREKPDLDYLANAQVDDMLTFLSHALVRMARLGSPRM
jgi:hypothetical protein